MAVDGCRNIRFPRYRQFVLDYMHLCRRIPLVTLDRPMRLAPIIEARNACRLRPAWTAIFIKAYAIMAARSPEMRRAYMSLSWQRGLYEHGNSRATFIVERMVEGEEIPLYSSIEQPESASLAELNEQVRLAGTRPLEEIPEFRILRWLVHVPRPIRRFLWGVAFHWSGWGRAQWFGTFGITSTASLGAGLLKIVTGIPTLHHGLFDDKGCIEMRLTVDHRAIDGAPAARALATMEEILHTEILDELRQLGSISGAA